MNGYEIAQKLVENMENWNMWYEVLGEAFQSLLDKEVKEEDLKDSISDGLREWDLGWII